MIKSKIHEQQLDSKIYSTSVQVNLNQILIGLKKILRIIFKFHIKNKKILFLGLNGPVTHKINKKTIHFAIPSKISIKSLVFNKTQSFKNNLKYSLFKLEKKPDLIVILDKTESYSSLINESYMIKIPIIALTKFNNNLSEKKISIYNIFTPQGFLPHNSNNNKEFLYNCLKFLFRKPNNQIKHKKKFNSKKSKNWAKHEKKKI